MEMRRQLTDARASKRPAIVAAPRLPEIPLASTGPTADRKEQKGDRRRGKKAVGSHCGGLFVGNKTSKTSRSRPSDGPLLIEEIS